MEAYTNEYFYEKIMSSESLSPRTKKTYVSRMKFLLKKSGEERVIDLISNICETEMVLKSESSLSNRTMYYSLILSYIKYGELKDGESLSNRWMELAQDTFKEVDLQKNIPTKSQKNVKITWNGVRSKLDDLDKTSEQYLLLKTLVVFIENDIDIDYSNIKLASTEPYDSSTNYICLDVDMPFVHVGKSKTIRYTGEYDKTLPLEYVKEVKKITGIRENLFVKKGERVHGDWRNEVLKYMFEDDGMSLTMMRYLFKVARVP
jgi:hypothetical protein